MRVANFLRRFCGKLLGAFAIVAGGCTTVHGANAVGVIPALLVAEDGQKYPFFQTVTVVKAFESVPQKTLHWLNDEEILFIGLRPQPQRYAEVVSVWNIHTGAIREVRDFGAKRTFVCFNDGHLLLLAFGDDGSREVLYGRVDSLRQVDAHKDYSEIFCRSKDQLPPQPKYSDGRGVAWLGKANEGYVDFGELLLRNPRGRLHKPGAGNDSVELPFGRRDVRNFEFPYYKFKDAFFVESDYWRFPRPKEISYPVYWLYRDGRVEKILDIPWGPWRAGGSMWSLPTKAGIVVVSHRFNVRNSYDLADAGMYLMTPSKTVRVAKAWIQTGVVSPDGCKVAFSYAPFVTAKENTLRAVDLCSPRR